MGELWPELLRLDTSELLKLEKRRRGAPEDKLLFVNAANLANFWWCAQKALLQARKDELAFFISYVLQGAEVATPGLNIEESDPVELLQLVERMYKTHDPDEVLRRVLESKKEADVELYHSVKIGDRILTPIRRGNRLVILGKGLEVVDECDLVRGDHSGVCREVLRAACAGPERVGWELGGLEDRRLARGVALQEILAERHPTILWAKEWDKYVVVGVPDGVGGDFVYEFKTTKIRRFDKYVLPVARTQANIYTWLFKRQRWVVEIFSCTDLKLYRWEGDVDYAEVERTLKGFKAVEEGGEAVPPMCWKCERCEYRDHCRLKEKCK